MKTPQHILDANQRWRERNREKVRAKSLEYHYAHRDTLLARKREKLREENVEVNARRRYRKWGLTSEQFIQMMEAQGGGCAICGADAKLVVDHCHETGQIRALLCSQCNTALGLMAEDETRIKKLADYAQWAASLREVQ